MTRTTVAVTTLSGSPALNVIASSARAGLNIRIMVGDTVAGVLEHLRRTIRDDDIRIEPDSILRALAMNRFAKRPTLVGGQMLNLQEPSHLHVMGEMVDAESFMWSGAVNTEYDHDFAKYPGEYSGTNTSAAPSASDRWVLMSAPVLIC